LFTTTSLRLKVLTGRIAAMLEIAVFSTKNSTINNSVNFQNFPIKFCTMIAKLFSIISCKCGLNRLKFSYFIVKRVVFFIGYIVYFWVQHIQPLCNTGLRFMIVLLKPWSQVWQTRYDVARTLRAHWRAVTAPHRIRLGSAFLKSLLRIDLPFTYYITHRGGDWKCYISYIRQM